MASRGVNKVIIIGNLGNDPEVKFLPNGSNAVANLTVATSESWKDKNTGENKEVTEWHRCVAYGKVAEICGQYLNKGSKVYLEGKLKTRKWQGQDGQDRYTTEIVFDQMQMLDSKPQGNQQQGNQQSQGQWQQQQQQTNNMHQQSQQMPDFDDMPDW